MTNKMTKEFILNKLMEIWFSHVFYQVKFAVNQETVSFSEAESFSKFDYAFEDWYRTLA